MFGKENATLGTNREIYYKTPNKEMSFLLVGSFVVYRKGRLLFHKTYGISEERKPNKR